MARSWEAEFMELWRAGVDTAAIARQLGIPQGTVSSRAHTLQRQGKIEPRPRGGAQRQRGAQTRQAGTPEEHPSTPKIYQRSTRAHPGTPDAHPTPVHPGTPTLPAQQPTGVHPSTPSSQSTPAHPSVPIPDDAAMRLLSLLPDLEAIVARERDRQRLLSTPIGTPRHTTKKTYVVDTLYVDLIERYAQAEGVELKEVVNLAFHEFFERRDYLPPADHP